MAVDELYWNSIDFGSDESIPNHASGKQQYVDPWDLENYAYIRQHLDSIDLSSDPSSEQLDSGNSASFYYVPGSAKKSTPRYDSMTDQATSNYAAIDDVNPYGRTRRNRQESGYGSHVRTSRRHEEKHFDSFDSGNYFRHDHTEQYLNYATRR